MTDLHDDLEALPPVDDTFSGQVDYFGRPADFIHYLPDGKTWVTIKFFMEGERRHFQNKINKDVKIARGSGDMALKLAPGDERYELLSLAITGWNLVKDGKPFPFTPRSLKDFLDLGSTVAIDNIEKKVRELNPWLGSELSVEDIDKEIERLQELRAQRVEQDRGKLSS
jgi:hypothetical protein